MRNVINLLVGVLGSIVTYLFGGWSTMLETLIIFMIIDYLTGIICAGVFKKSPKSDSGALSSKVGFKGIIKKCMILVMIVVAYRIDVLLSANLLILSAVEIAFISNEAISILENCNAMGLPIPDPLRRAVASLEKESDKDESSIL